jgi:hypothetical protein
MAKRKNVGPAALYLGGVKIGEVLSWDVTDRAPTPAADSWAARAEEVTVAGGAVTLSPQILERLYAALGLPAVDRLALPVVNGKRAADDARRRNRGEGP